MTTKTLTQDGKSWTLGQTARSRKFAYTGKITILYPRTATAPARAWIMHDDDKPYGRITTLDDLEVAS